MEINNEQREIINHTLRNGLYCGDSPDMKILCDNGLMEFAGKKSFVPDPYFRVTAKGKKAIC